MLSLTLDELKTIILSEYCNLPPCSLTARQITGLLCLYLQHLWVLHCSNMILNMVDKLAGLFSSDMMPFGMWHAPAKFL